MKPISDAEWDGEGIILGHVTYVHLLLGLHSPRR